MNKYTLTFNDKNLEKDYQKSCLQKRYKALKIITYTVIVSLSIKSGQAILQGNLSYLIDYLSISTYLLIQLFIVNQKQKYERVALVLLNHFMSIYLYSEINKVDTKMAMLLGVNQMAFTILLILSSDYAEGVVTIFILSTYRLIWTVHYSDDIQYASLVASILLCYYISYFNYEFHQGKRSQFLLQFVDSHWEDVLKKLSAHQPYLIIQFQEENLSFTITDNHCQKLLSNSEQTKKEFLQQSVIGGKSLSNYLFSKIVQQRNSGYKPQDIVLNYQKSSYLVEICIYQVKHLNVLLIFKDFDQSKQHNYVFHKKRTNQFCHIILNILQKCQKQFARNSQYFQMQRKIVILYLYENLKMNSEYQNVNFYQFLNKVVYYCPNIKINLFVSVPIDQIIHTHYKLFMMVMLIIFENSLQSKALINCKIDKNKQFKIYIKGNFNTKSITNILKPHKNNIEILFKETILNKQLITLTHKSEILIPFQIND